MAGSSNHDTTIRKKGIPWPTKAALLLAAVIAGVFDHATAGWGEPIMIAIAAVVVPLLLLQYRSFWNQARFWITVLMLSGMQVPLVFALKRLAAKSVQMLGIGILDAFFVGIIIFLVCSEQEN